VFLAKRIEADFQTWRDHRDWTAEKYRRFDRGERMPHQCLTIGKGSLMSPSNFPTAGD
jgi:hypothetical protein